MFGFSRYYQPLTPGKNFLLLSPLGIKGYDQRRNPINTISVWLFSDFKSEEEVVVSMGRILHFKDTYEVLKYKENSEFKVNHVKY